MRICCLIGLIAFIAAGCGSGGQPAEVVRPVAEWVIDRGGWIEIESSSLKVREKTRIPQGPFRITAINLNEREVDSRDLERLVPLEGLLRLELHSTRVDDAGMEHVAKLVSLTHLELSNTRVADKGLGPLASLRALESLFLYNTPVTEDAVKELRSRLPDATIRF